MSLAQKKHDTWSGYLAKTGKVDRKGLTLNKQQKMDIDPNHMGWLDLALGIREELVQRIGKKNYQTFRDTLPEEVTDPTIWTLRRQKELLERALIILENDDLDPKQLALVSYNLSKD